MPELPTIKKNNEVLRRKASAEKSFNDELKKLKEKYNIASMCALFDIDEKIIIFSSKKLPSTLKRTDVFLEPSQLNENPTISEILKKIKNDVSLRIGLGDLKTYFIVIKNFSSGKEPGETRIHHNICLFLRHVKKYFIKKIHKTP